MQNSILVIIVTYNGAQWINRCLDSLKSSLTVPSVYIVDNSSTDDTVEIIKSQYSEFMLHESTENMGFGGANNIGLCYAMENNFDYVYLLNQDAWVMPNTIGVMIETKEKYPEYGILSPLQTNAEMTKLDANFLKRCNSRDQMFSDFACGVVEDVYCVSFTMAAHWLISKECLMDVGVFSPIFFHYGEDNNYVHRAQYFGYKVGIVPSVVGVHDREFREKTKVQNLYMTIPLYLIKLSNINSRFFKATYKALIKSLERIFKHSIRYRDISIIFITIPKLFVINKVRQDRAKNKIKGYYFQKKKL